jgi:NTF2 fold immunity protein
MRAIKRFLCSGVSITAVLLLIGCNEGRTTYIYKGVEAESSQRELESYAPKGGVVSSPEIASKIAEVIAISVYGKNQIYSEQPYIITDRENMWFIRGSIRTGLKGGVFEIIIQKEDGTIVYINHGE